MSGMGGAHWLVIRSQSHIDWKMIRPVLGRVRSVRGFTQANRT
jgi:hypothetical protein